MGKRKVVAIEDSHTTDTDTFREEERQNRVSSEQMGKGKEEAIEDSLTPSPPFKHIGRAKNNHSDRK